MCVRVGISIPDMHISNKNSNTFNYLYPFLSFSVLKFCGRTDIFRKFSFFYWSRIYIHVHTYPDYFSPYDIFLTKVSIPDHVLFDYHLFRPLQNSLNAKTFNNDEAKKSHFVLFFAEKDQKFYERGIMNLPERWQEVIEQNGNILLIKVHAKFYKNAFTFF